MTGFLRRVESARPNVHPLNGACAEKDVLYASRENATTLDRPIPATLEAEA